MRVAQGLFDLKRGRFITFVVRRRRFFLPCLVSFHASCDARPVGVFVVRTVFLRFWGLQYRYLARIRGNATTGLNGSCFVNRFLARLVEHVGFLYLNR